MAKIKIKKWRRINPYICDRCGHKRSSYIFDRAKGKICQKCLRDEVPDNQPSLFNPLAATSPEDFGEKFNSLAHHK